MIDPLTPIREALAAAADQGQGPVRLATVTGTSGSNVLVQFDGEAAASTKSYRRLVSYGTVTNGHRVVMLRAGSTWVVLGALA